MRDLNYQLKQLRHRNRDGGYATQADRAGFLQFVADQLHEAGFRDLHATGLKPKHVEALCQRWQAAFGLRRAESIKIQPAWADRRNALVLRASWCKGGRERSIPMRTEAQHLLLHEANMFAGRGSLIPHGSRYADQLRRFEHQCSKAGIHNVHGHRHAYAQARYKALTG